MWQVTAVGGENAADQTWRCCPGHTSQRANLLFLKVVLLRDLKTKKRKCWQIWTVLINEASSQPVAAPPCAHCCRCVCACCSAACPWRAGLWWQRVFLINTGTRSSPHKTPHQFNSLVFCVRTMCFLTRGKNSKALILTNYNQKYLIYSKYFNYIFVTVVQSTKFCTQCK